MGVTGTQWQWDRVLNSNVRREVRRYRGGCAVFASAGARAWGSQNGFTVRVDAVSSKDEGPDLEGKPKVKAQLRHLPAT